jgi:hypothetical protein
MHGDYSRGHEPDRKRGRNYRRVLLQMGRPVLDSDVASMVDALLGEVRATTRGLGCAAASPDFGFLVTPGRLIAVLAEAEENLEVTQGTPDAWIDYRFRFAERYPALYLAATGTAARVTLAPLQPLDPAGPARAALWARVEAPTTIQLNGISVSLAPDSPDTPQRVEFPTGVATLDPLEIGVAAGDEVWLFLLEQDEVAGDEPAFWIAPGSYHVDGLVVDTGRGGPFPALAFPDAAGFPWSESPVPAPPLDGLLAPAALAAGTRLVAYLEAWERHITAVEDPGIREEALGSSDTSARTELLGQVKLATLSGVLPAGAAAAGVVRGAFDAVEVSGGQLTIDVPDTTPTTDPCALPDIAGYSGSDNRLYRVEVHRGGGLSQVQLKWSRDNGSEVFAARLDTSKNLVFDPGIALAAGDIVEVLSNVVDLGDDALADVNAGGFVPARRAVGQLAQLAPVEVASSADEVVFRLVETEDVTTPVTLDDRYGTLRDAVLKLRRWHGLLDPGALAGGGAASPGPHVLEDGVSVELSSTGSYRPGQWWQYEARVHGQNANGPWRPAPHGPERRFAPLALLEFQSATEPLRLLAWLDERFSHPCDLDADDLVFAGARVGSASDTVQEALEELFERPPEIVDASCGELIIRPENGDLQTVFDTIAAGQDRRICFQPGTWTVEGTITITGKGDLIISGAGDATRLGGNVDSVLRFTDCGNVRIQDLTVEGGKAAVEGDGLAGAISAVNCAGLDLQRVNVSCGGSLTRRISAVEVRSDGPALNTPEVRVHDCRVEAGHAQVGLLVVNAASVDIEGNTIVSPEQPMTFVSTLTDPDIAGRVANLLISDYVIGKTAQATDELLVGSPNILIEVDPVQGRRRFIVHLESWGSQFITFSTTLGLPASAWQALFEANPIPGTFSEAPAAAGFVAAHLRAFRRQLVNRMFGLTSTAMVPAGPLEQLTSLGSTIGTRNSFAAGDQGIVVGGQGTPINKSFPEPRVLTGDLRPDARIVGNRILGFAQGIHVAASGTHKKRGVSYRVSIADNVVHLRVPGLGPEPHGIFVGSVFHLRLQGNSVEVRTPGPAGWPSVGALDAISIFGTFGPLIQVHENSCIGSRNGVAAHAINRARATTTGWKWTVSGNAHVGSGGGTAELINW